MDAPFSDIEEILGTLEGIRRRLASSPMNIVGGYGNLTWIAAPLDESIDRIKKVIKGER